jgi:hypothetical protein
MRVYLISENVLKKRSLINDATLGKYIKPAIEIAQNIDLKQIIGKNLLDKICDLCYEENDQHVKLIDLPEYAQYKLLMTDYITDYMCYMTMCEIQMGIHNKMRNAGVTQSTDENYIQASLQEVNFNRQYWKDKGEFVGNEMQRYIIKNKNLYPEFNQCCDNTPIRDSFQCGIVI